MMKNRPRIGIYPGTFDPVTIGHLDLLKRGMPLVDKLIIGVAKYSDKEPLFSLEERVEMVRHEISQLDLSEHDIEIVVEPFDSLLIDFARQHNAIMLLRGLRAVSDFEYEFKMAAMNGHLAPEVETVFLMASDKFQFVSSRFIKQIARLGGDVSQFVSAYVLAKLNAHFGGNKHA